MLNQIGTIVVLSTTNSLAYVVSCWPWDVGGKMYFWLLVVLAFHLCSRFDLICICHLLISDNPRRKTRASIYSAAGCAHEMQKLWLQCTNQWEIAHQLLGCSSYCSSWYARIRTHKLNMVDFENGEQKHAKGCSRLFPNARGCSGLHIYPTSWENKLSRVLIMTNIFQHCSDLNFDLCCLHTVFFSSYNQRKNAIVGVDNTETCGPAFFYLLVFELCVC